MPLTNDEEEMLLAAEECAIAVYVALRWFEDHAPDAEVVIIEGGGKDHEPMDPGLLRAKTEKVVPLLEEAHESWREAGGSLHLHPELQRMRQP